MAFETHCIEDMGDGPWIGHQRLNLPIARIMFRKEEVSVTAVAIWDFVYGSATVA